MTHSHVIVMENGKERVGALVTTAEALRIEMAVEREGSASRMVTYKDCDLACFGGKA